MKRFSEIAIFLIFFSFYSQIFAFKNTFLQDAYSLTDKNKALIVVEENIEKAGPADFARAVNLYHYYLDQGSVEEKKKAYIKAIKALDSIPELQRGAEFYALLALMWARYAEIEGGIMAAEKIKKYSEISLKINPDHDKRDVYVVLGRLHFKTPNIPVVLSWPDKKLARKYLETALKFEPDSLIAKFFLADVLWETGEKSAAERFYKEVAISEPRKGMYWKDIKTKILCEKRMKELGIK